MTNNIYEISNINDKIKISDIYNINNTYLRWRHYSERLLTYNIKLMTHITLIKLLYNNIEINTILITHVTLMKLFYNTID